jgi:hypothetical protein
VLDFTILRRGLWIGHPQDDPTRGKNHAGGGIVKLTVVVTLDDFDGAAKLCENKDKNLDKVRKVSEFTRKGKVHIK